MNSPPLVIITARRGSKGIPGKNWRPLAGEPLISHSIRQALSVSNPEHICVTTDAPEILEIAEALGVAPGFVRPAPLSDDHADSRSVMLHAIDEMHALRGNSYEHILLLQPTSPFRSREDILGTLALYDDAIDMSVSAVETHANPYFTVFLADDHGMLRKAIPSNMTRRQDCPKAYMLNGAISVINVCSMRERPIAQFERVRCYEMPAGTHVDLDTELDWKWAEFLLSEGVVEL
jgi:N-acylneuraminate cytidylyltransferase